MYYANIPLMAGINYALYTDCLQSFYGDKYDKFTNLLLVTDVILFLDSVLLFSVISKIVSSISYCANSDELKVLNFNNWFLTQQTTNFKPQ